MKSSDDIRDYEVYNTKTGARGLVISVDPLTISINIGGKPHHFTHATFNKHWVIVPQDVDEEEVEEEFVDDEPTGVDRWGYPTGKAGVGVVLRDRFMDMVRDVDLKDALIFHDPKTRTDIVKYNGFNIFECKYTNRRFIVLAHPKSLTPMNRKKIYEMIPPEWKWVMEAKFIFTKLNQWPLMKSIINDGLFYRSDNYIEY